MKRCPKCEFIYEEDQRLCDMDGTTLVHDSHLRLDNDPRTIGAKSVWKLFVQIGLPLIVLSMLAFYVFKHQTSAQNATPPSPVSNSSEMPATSAAAPHESASQQQDTLSAAEPRDAKSSDPSRDSASPNPDTSAIENEPTTASSNVTSTVTPVRMGKSETPRAAARPSKPTSQKKESKIGAFLKKTGRFLTKPFKQ